MKAHLRVCAIEALLFGPFAKRFYRWAEGYYDQKLSSAAIEALGAKDRILVSETVAALNSTFDLQAVRNSASAVQHHGRATGKGPQLDVASGSFLVCYALQ